MYLRQILKEKKITARQLAEKVNVSEAAISNYSSGKREPESLDILVAIADALDVSLDLLVRGKEKEPPTEARERLEESTFAALAALPPQEQRIARAVLDALIARQG